MNAPLPEAIRQGSRDRLSRRQIWRLATGRAFHEAAWQALVAACRCCKRSADSMNGLNTAGFVSGYPRLAAGRLRPGAVGSEKKTTRRRRTIVFPARVVNEELAADPRVVGARSSLDLYKETNKFDGVCSGNLVRQGGRGVDRCLPNVFKHANMGRQPLKPRAA